MESNSPKISYQPIPAERGPQPRYQSPSLYTTARNNPNLNMDIIQNYQKTDQQFYSSLTKYTPLCYTGHGTPFFLLNQGWYLSLGCILVLNSLFLMVIFMFLRTSGTGPRAMSQADIRKFTIINFVAMGSLTFTYILTQFMNPGIRNLSTISQEQYEKHGRFYCSRCNGDRTGKMQHCRQCEVCIQSLDHHCGFFSKCIGGWQTFAFYAFLLSTFAGFFALIITMISNIGL